MKRWIIKERHVLGHADLVKPFPGGTQVFPTADYPGWGDGERETNRSYWHKDKTNVLYEDGSVQTRAWGEPLGIGR